jgi:hypothetical protein
MNQDHMNRRDFHKLSALAMGGMMAGSLAGCGTKTEKTAEPPAEKPEADTAGIGAKNDPALAQWTVNHLCRGLNACKGLGSDRKNDCAGLGECAITDHHTCGGQNDCKNLGGCGETAASNECKGQGGCQVPLMEAAWKTAYEKFKADMTKAGYADKLPKPPGPPKL